MCDSFLRPFLSLLVMASNFPFNSSHALTLTHRQADRQCLLPFSCKSESAKRRRREEREAENTLTGNMYRIRILPYVRQGVTSELEQSFPFSAFPFFPRFPTSLLFAIHPVQKCSVLDMHAAVMNEEHEMKTGENTNECEEIFSPLSLFLQDIESLSLTPSPSSRTCRLLLKESEKKNVSANCSMQALDQVKLEGHGFLFPAHHLCSLLSQCT